MHGQNEQTSKFSVTAKARSNNNKKRGDTKVHVELFSQHKESLLHDFTRNPFEFGLLFPQEFSLLICITHCFYLKLDIELLFFIGL